ncbi:ATP-binding protein [Sulfolobus sp. E5-1-F]|uniref:AAA family ATPase n=1 Tax=Sulfolobaceae TaxID=118883 RepID=UPI001297AA24|nr:MULTISPECIES: ATP-binding protein [unclassified Sulfolobus]QGA53666.1 ATP-binding protein [Sulfolobus sp. E5-1-F]QGA68678.1 ATP-binding protein [Sulfolobus sp. E11-6]
MKFIFGKPVDEPFDRENEVKQLVEMMNRRQPVAIIGVRRIGKTSVILKSLKIIETPKVYISVEDFIEGKSFDLVSFLSLYSSLLITNTLNYVEPKRKISQIVKQKGKELLDKLRELIGYVKLSFNINLVEVEVFLNSVKRGGVKESIPQILELPERLAEEFGLNTIVVAIDEFQYLKLASQNYPGIFHLLRSKWQFHNKVSYVISGSSVGLLEKIFYDKKEPFYQFFFPIYIKQFDKNTSFNFLKQGFRDEGKDYEDNALLLAIEELDGIPAWLNYFGLKSLQCNEVTLECAKKVIEDITFNDPIVRGIVQEEYNKLGKNARIILKYLAEKGGKGDLKGLELGKASINEGLKSLLGSGYIVKEERGKYAIIDPVIVKVLKSSTQTI